MGCQDTVYDDIPFYIPPVSTFPIIGRYPGGCVVEAGSLYCEDKMSRTILSKVDGFTPVIDCIVKDTSPMTALVFGRIWRYCQMENGVCNASLETIASGIGIDEQTARRHIKELIEAGYIKDASPDLRNRPHTYIDTGKAGISMEITGGIKKSDLSDGGIKESGQGYQKVTAGVSKSKMKIDSKIDSKTQPSEGENSTSEAIKAANKTVDVLFAMQREADARKSYMHREQMPDAIRDLMDVFWAEYGINCISKSDWIMTGNEWIAIGAKPADVRTACERARPDANGRGGLTNVTRPGSITGLVNAVVGERNKGGGGSDLLSFIRSYKEKNG